MTKKQMKLQFERMAKLKLEIKQKEVEYKEIEEKVYAAYPEEFFENALGTFKKSSRTTYDIADKNAVIKEMGLHVYKLHSSISKTGIEQGIGEKGFKKLFEKKAIIVKNIAEFFLFKPIKA